MRLAFEKYLISGLLISGSIASSGCGGATVQEPTEESIAGAFEGSAQAQALQPSEHHRRRESGSSYVEPAHCHLTRIFPQAGAVDVALNTHLQIEFSRPVAPDDLGRALQLYETHSKRALPVVLKALNSTTIEVTPAPGLDFWRHYTLQVKDFTDLKNRPCRDVKTSFAALAPVRLPAPLVPSSSLQMAQVGNYIYSTAPSLRVIQIHESGPNGLENIGQLKLNTGSNALSAAGERVYVAAGEDGLLVIDTQHPELPQIAATIALPGQARQVAPFEREAESWAAVSLGAQGVALVNLTNLAAPQVSMALVSAAADMDSTSDTQIKLSAAVSVSVAQNRLAVADTLTGTVLFDISNPSKPLVLGHSPTLRPLQVQLAGNRLFVLYAGSHARVLSFDTENLSTPLGRFEGCGACGNEVASGFVHTEDKLHVALRQGGIQSLQILPTGELIALQPEHHAEDPSFSVLQLGEEILSGGVLGITRFDSNGAVAQSPASRGAGDAHEIAIDQGLAYVASSFRGLMLFDTSSPLSPRLLRSVVSPGLKTSHDRAALNIHLTATAGLLGDGRAGVSVFPLDSTTGPRQLQGQISDEIDSMGAMQSLGEIAFVCNSNHGLEVLDVSNPLQPLRLPPLDFEPGIRQSCLSLLLHNDEQLLYLGGRDRLLIVDTSSPAAPQWRSEFQFRASSRIVALARREQLLYLSTRENEGSGTQTLQILNINNPLRPILKWTSTPKTQVGALQVFGHLLFVADDASVEFYRIETEHPQLLGVVPTQSVVRGLTATAAALYVAESTSGLSVIRTGPLSGLSEN